MNVTWQLAHVVLEKSYRQHLQRCKTQETAQQKQSLKEWSCTNRKGAPLFTRTYCIVVKYIYVINVFTLVIAKTIIVQKPLSEYIFTYIVLCCFILYWMIWPEK